jgi:hypothetical protein
MWNYLKGLLRNGSLLSKFLVGSLLFVVIMTFFALVGSSSKDAVSFLAIGGFAAFKRYKDRITNFLKNVDTVPYWGNKFGRDICIRLLSEDKFRPYVNKKGQKVRGFSVSESGRWFCINGQYYPTYLVYDYNRSSSEITMIDGTQIDSGDWKFDYQITQALNEYLGTDRNLRLDDASHDMITTSDCTRAFKRILQGNYEDLATSDWDEFRYRWEKELSEIKVANLNRMNARDHAKALRDKSIAGEALHTRVLMDEEINVIAHAIRNDEIKDISDWFKLNAFKDDMCVCNGVSLLKDLGYPTSKVGTLFLFDCLRDIQKPYFEDAVITLEKFPIDELVPIIESHVETAHATGDVLWGAGLLYLSKRIGYTISLAQGSVALDDPIAAIFRDKPEPMVQTQGKF